MGLDLLPAANVDDGSEGVESRTVDTAVRARPKSIVIGTEASTNGDVHLPLAALRHHTAIFAGSGSGKSVLIRRLVEEAALQGVSSIVFDATNDLSLLGSPWPEDDRTWPPGDANKAAAYLADTDVVVWTPGTSSGRDLNLATTGLAAPTDPGDLLTPIVGKRARVSVINLSGLAGDADRQAFVRDVQAGIGAWIGNNPAADDEVRGLLVIDEAQHLLSSGYDVTVESTLEFASQARDGGIGLIYATPSPKGVDDRIADSASTQFYGLLHSPSQVESARKLAEIKGGSVPDIGRLAAGQFYVAIEGAEFRRTVTPLCLSYHPKVSPSEDEVLELARS
nr:DUF87 domain-containing protein [Rhodococcus sp. (in: high G+C Gram-positive bacteria)]